MMKKIVCSIIIGLIGIIISGCEETPPQVDFKAILITGKWLVTNNTISPGVRFGNTISSPIITDVNSAISCQESKTSGAYFYFEDDGKIMNEIACSNSADFGKKISLGAKWELSADQKTLNITDRGSNISYEIISFDSNSLKIKGKVNYRDSYTNTNVLQDNFITFTKF